MKVQNRRSDSVPSPRFARERGTEYDSWWDNHGPMVRSYISAQSWKKNWKYIRQVESHSSSPPVPHSRPRARNLSHSYPNALTFRVRKNRSPPVNDLQASYFVGGPVGMPLTQQVSDAREPMRCDRKSRVLRCEPTLTKVELPGSEPVSSSHNPAKKGAQVRFTSSQRRDDKNMTGAD